MTDSQTKINVLKTSAWLLYVFGAAESGSGVGLISSGIHGYHGISQFGLIKSRSSSFESQMIQIYPKQNKARVS